MGNTEITKWGESRIAYQDDIYSALIILPFIRPAHSFVPPFFLILSLSRFPPPTSHRFFPIPPSVRAGICSTRVSARMKMGQAGLIFFRSPQLYSSFYVIKLYAFYILLYKILLYIKTDVILVYINLVIYSFNTLKPPPVVKYIYKLWMGVNSEYIRDSVRLNRH